MGTLVDIVHEIIHDESFGRLDLSIFVLPISALPNIYDSPPLSLYRSTHGNVFQSIHVDLDVFVLNSFAAYNHVDMEV